jgi:hypothetical protein
MGVWSTGDPALTEAQMTDSAENVAGPWRYERLDGPGHWMQLDAPDQVDALLLDFLRLWSLKAGNRAITVSMPGYILGPTPEKAQLWSRFLMPKSLWLYRHSALSTLPLTCNCLLTSAGDTGYY